MENALTSSFSDLVLGIDHVAIAVSDIEASIAWYTSALGFSLIERSEVSGVHSGMVYAIIISGASTIVLIQGTSPESQVTQFIAAKGEGIHHIALAVSDLDKTIDRVTAAGNIPDTPVVSDTGIRQAFLQRNPETGIRIELIERLGASFSKKNVGELFRVFEENDLY